MKLFIHPVFVLAVMVAVYYSATMFMAALVLAVIIHELSHAAGAAAFGIFPTRLTILPFGGQIDIDCEFLTARQKSIVLLSGPVGNFIAAIICGLLVWLFPIAFIYLEYIVAANFITGAMNLLPVTSFDGGKLLANYIGEKKILLFSNTVIAVLLAFSTIKLNLFMSFFTIIMLISINFSHKNTVFSSKICKKIGKIIEFSIISSQSLFEIYRLVERTRPTKFVVTDKGNFAFYENDLEQWLLRYPAHTKIGEIIG